MSFMTFFSGSRFMAALLLCLAAPLAGAQPVDDFFVAVRNDQAGDVARMLKGAEAPALLPAASSAGLIEAAKADAWTVYDTLLADPRVAIDQLNAFGETPLMYLAIKGETARMDALIARGAQVNKTGWTPLHYAATMGHDGAVRLLIEHHAYIDAESPDGTTPLMMAMKYNRAGTAKLLLDEGADGYARNAAGQNAAEVGRAAGNTRLANDLVERLNHERRRKSGR